MLVMMKTCLRKLFFLVSLSLPFNMEAQVLKETLGETFERRVVAKGLSDPWEIIYGPDKKLWITETKGYRVSLIDPATGKKQIILDLNAEKNFPRYDIIADEIDGGKKLPQGGLMGMALHPRLLKDKPYVYLAYVYYFSGADKNQQDNNTGGGKNYYKAKIARYRFDREAQKLTDPVVLCDTIPANNDHNGGRLLIAPVNEKLYLFYAVGDMGAGQFDNGGRKNHAQDISSYEGKILRFNIEPDAEIKFADQWIPDDNPFNSTTQSAVWSVGHRNPQGLAYAVIGNKGKIYSSEHGPYSDDEINIIEKGKNYGHPLVIGFNDGNYNGLAAGVSDKKEYPGKWHTSYPFIQNENANVEKIGKENYSNPIFTLYPNSNQFLSSLYEKRVSGTAEDVKWPSEAPSSIEFYNSTAIPGWEKSLLLPTLKGNKIIRLQLNATGDVVVGDTINYFKAKVRYRDIAVSDDGLKIYAVTDSSSVTSGPTEENSEKTYMGGSVIEFSYQAKSNKANNNNNSKKQNSNDLKAQKQPLIERKRGKLELRKEQE